MSGRGLGLFMVIFMVVMGSAILVDDAFVQGLGFIKWIVRGWGLIAITAMLHPMALRIRR